MCVLIFSTRFCEIFLILRRNNRDIIKKRILMEIKTTMEIKSTETAERILIFT